MYFFTAAGVCLISFSILQHKARLRGEYAANSTRRNWLQRTWADRSKRFWLALIIVAHGNRRPIFGALCW
jgi:hypothetical protein